MKKPGLVVSVPALLLASGMGSVAFGETMPSSAPMQDLSAPETSDETMIVRGTKPSGVVLGTIRPDVVVSEEEIEAYGVSSLAELLEQLAPQTGSSRGRGGGRPAILLNGRRISNFREIRQYPPEAIARVEILPEEAALKYGFKADQRVVNFVLKPNVKIYSAEAEAALPEGGGTTSTETEFRRLWIDGDRRFSLDAGYYTTSPLYESERTINFADPALPYSLQGTLAGTGPGGEIDPALSLLAGETVTSVTVPVSATMGPVALEDFAGAVDTQGDNNIQDWRSLIPDQSTARAGFSYSRPALAESSATLSGQIEYQDSYSLNGLATAAIEVSADNPFSPFAEDAVLYRYLTEAGPLYREEESLTGNLGLTVNGRRDDWNWTLTGNANRVDSDTTAVTGADVTAVQDEIDANSATLNPFADYTNITLLTEQTESITGTYNASALANGPVMETPAGDATLSLSASLSQLDLDTTTLQAGTETAASLSRTVNGVQTSLDIPLTNPDDGDLEWFGDFAVNANLAYDDYSDFGGLSIAGYGLTWSPDGPFRFLVSATHEETAPSLNQLGAPVTITPGQRVYDFVAGESVFATILSGGNADLAAGDRDVYKAGFVFEPKGGGREGASLTLSMDYVTSVIRDETIGFPALTADVEAAFPDRFIRDADGTLLQIDRRPVNIAEATSEEIRTRVSLMKRSGSPMGRSMSSPGGKPSAKPSPGTPPQQAAPEKTSTDENKDQSTENSKESSGETAGKSRKPAGASRTAGGGGRGTRGGPPKGYRLSLEHVWHLEDTVILQDGVDPIDLLNGDTLTNSSGQPEHEVEFYVVRWNDGRFVRMRANWQSGTRVNGSGPDYLDFEQTGTVDVRVGYRLENWAWLRENYPWTKNSRIAFSVDNVFDHQQKITDETGLVPLNYQPDLLDPRGRVFEIDLRKRW